MKGIIIKLTLLILLGFSPSIFAHHQPVAAEYLALEKQALSDPKAMVNTLVSSADFVSLSPAEQAFRYTLTARLQLFLGEVNAATNSFNLAKAQLPEGENWVRGYWLLHHSWLTLEQGNLPTSLNKIEQATTIFNALNAFEMITRTQIYHSIYLLWEEDYPASLSELEKAYTQSETKHMSAITRTDIYAGLAAYYIELGFYEKGIQYAQKGKQLALKANSIVQALSISPTLCTSYERAKQLDASFYCYEQMSNLAEKINIDRYIYLAVTGQARIALAQQKYDIALTLLSRAEQLTAQITINPAYHIALSNNLARAYLGLEQPEKALQQTKKTEKIIDNYHRPLNNRYRRQTMMLQAKIFAKMQMHQQQAQALDQYIQLLEQAKKTTQRNLEQKVRTSFEAKQQDIKLQLANEELKYQKANLERLEQQEKLRSAYIIIVLVVLVAISLVALSQQRAYRKVQKIANTDSLTRVPNRRYIMNYMSDLVGKSTPFSVCILDIDKFKTINDSYGHDIGDQALKALGQTLKGELQGTDYQFARLGGEEFLVVMPQLNNTQAYEVAEKLRQAIKATPMTQEKLTITVSGGVAYTNTQLSISPLLRMADTKLYQAKATGRDKVEY